MIRDVSTYRRTEILWFNIHLHIDLLFRELPPSPRIQKKSFRGCVHMQLFMSCFSCPFPVDRNLPTLAADHHRTFCVHCICCKNSSASVSVICEEGPRWDRRSWGQDHVGPAVADTTISAIWQIESGYMGVSLNGGTPKTPQNDHILVGKPMVVWYHHFRKPPYLVTQKLPHLERTYVFQKWTAGGWW